jgi:AraC family L-rhamnose operon transcriptional activator RhaR
MRKWRPILLSELGIRLPGVEVLGVALNRHLAETNRVRGHSHLYCQFLLYLTGRGRQVIDGEEIPVGPGRLVFLRPGERHAFRKERARRPLCLAVDLVLEEGAERCLRERQMTSGEMAAVRQILVKLMEAKELEVRSGALILELVHLLLSAAGWVEVLEKGRVNPVTGKVEKVLGSEGGLELGPREIAEAVGLQLDYLNRVLKRECGLTAGQMLAGARLEKAKNLLKGETLVGDVAEAVGMLDQNYFARWFKGQTGVTPSAWRQELVKTR